MSEKLYCVENENGHQFGFSDICDDAVDLRNEMANNIGNNRDAEYRLVEGMFYSDSELNSLFDLVEKQKEVIRKRPHERDLFALQDRDALWSAILKLKGGV